MIDNHNALGLEELAVSGARTVTFTGTTVDISQYAGILKVNLSSAAGTGTTPTLNGRMQTGNLADGSDAVDVPGATFTPVGTVASLQAIGVDTRACGRFVRFVGTIAGTTPSFNFAVLAVGRRRVI